MKLNEHEVHLYVQSSYERLQPYKGEERPEMNDHIEALKMRDISRFQNNVVEFDTKMMVMKMSLQRVVI